jgi:hypothetical protein
MSCVVRCGNRAATRDGTANSHARTDRSRSSSRSFSVGAIATALVARRLVLALRPVGHRAQATISGTKGWRWRRDPRHSRLGREIGGRSNDGRCDRTVLCPTGFVQPSSSNDRSVQWPRSPIQFATLIELAIRRQAIEVLLPTVRARNIDERLARQPLAVRQRHGDVD